MPETIFVGVAWPYANGPLHLGHLAGANLAPDIFARYHRARGNRVLMVSGSDCHGTPVTLRAEAEGIPPAELAERYHQSFLESWRQLGIVWDLYTKTVTENHHTVVQDVFSRLLQRDYVYRQTMQEFFCPTCNRFLPDRYVEGTCPHCGGRARGDQCPDCGRVLDANELIDPVCKISSDTPRLADTEHFFLDLAQFDGRLREWIADKGYWKSNVKAFTMNLLDSGLRGRPITRDIEWGVRVPVEGFEHKRMYVWFDAVIGYLSASKEWAQSRGEPEAWREFWEPPAKSYYFIGKDNITFHTVIWPSMLMGYGDLLLPYDVPSNEFLTLEGRPLSTSQDWAIWAPDFLSRYDPDPLRYMFSINMPELADTDFSWREFVRRNNDELIAAYGNFVHRVLTITTRNFDHRVPEPGDPSPTDRQILARAQTALDTVGAEIAACRFRSAIGEAMALAREGNKYFNDEAPWSLVKTDPARAATVLNTCLQLISALKTLCYPFLPFSSQRIHEMLNCEGTLGNDDWAIERVPAGRELREPVALFKRLDDSIVAEEVARLHVSSPPP
ncbi:methionine--tRNA ligase [candidate division KD3-62 bacterium DG_56]|uniref:Methionine--tRNA ligase n=1 Tax=candidate division KD3-62 bacterium DG_56 TaxID=1704032 RepID=A0A0S7XP88_9BACT|nr:MAG: methionine--tRNA ligase [candidate division KD3-62 bacterium DG_56]